MEWPACSPDINPIERVWDRFQVTLFRRNQQPNNLRELGDALMEIWRELPQRVLHYLVESMERRCIAVIMARGGHTRY